MKPIRAVDHEFPGLRIQSSNNSENVAEDSDADVSSKEPFSISSTACSYDEYELQNDESWEYYESESVDPLKYVHVKLRKFGQSDKEDVE